MDCNLSDIMLEICGNEFSEYEKKPTHKFSYRFRRKMDKVIQSQYVPRSEAQAATIRRMKYAIIALVTAVVLLSGFIVTDTVFMKNGGDLYGFDSFTVKFAGTAPKTILNYYEPAVPEGYERVDSFSYSTDKFHTVHYSNGDTAYTFSQSVISEFFLGIEKDKAITEYSYSEDKITISYEGGNLTDTVWCDGVYVYHLTAVGEDGGLLDLENLTEVYPEEIKTAEEIFSEKY